ncbi:MAG: EAL domain-containing protein [Pseudomonadales bacterium]|nr:EAL domain-containing protein [Pseudomonadales bacterium]
MHRLLNQQLKEFIPEDVKLSLHEFFAAIDASYTEADEAQALLQHSLDTTSKNLEARNRDLKAQLDKQHKTQIELNQTLDLMRSTLEASMEAVLVIDSIGKPIVFNDNFLRLWNLSRHELEISDAEKIYQAVEFHLVNNDHFCMQVQRLQRGSYNHGHKTSETYELLDGRVVECDGIIDEHVGTVWSFREITEKYRQEERILHQAHHDGLTGLPNRVLLNDRVAHAIGKSQRKNGSMALFYLDLDGFKNINDSLGHDAGDYLLISVAQRLKDATRIEDTVARVGGDEFVILLEETAGQQNIICIAERVLEALQEPVVYRQHELYTSTSIGVALFPGDGQTTAELSKNADIALYQAKKEGKNRFHFFTASLERMAKHRLSIETQLRAAVKKGDFELYYQPEYDLNDGRLLGVEALIRWSHQGRFIPPDTFIPIAESTGLILAIGEWVMEHACRQSLKWRKAGFTDFYIAINLSPKQFQQGDIFQQTMACLHKHKLPPQALAIEITEGMAIDNLQQVSTLLNKFRQAGIKVCMDDFGTGYSSLNYLKMLPIDILKIDRSFVQDLTESSQNIAIATSIIALGHNLGHSVLAEGIETVEQLNILKRAGCDIGQGYLFAKPMPAKEILFNHPTVNVAQELEHRGAL